MNLYARDQGIKPEFFDDSDFGLKFDPEKATKKDLVLLANHLDEYVNMCDEMMIIPPGLIDSEDNIKEAFKVIRKLITKLRKGDKSVFKDHEEWN